MLSCFFFFLKRSEVECRNGDWWSKKGQSEGEGEALPYPPLVRLEESAQWYHASAGKPPDIVCFSLWWKWKADITFMVSVAYS